MVGAEAEGEAVIDRSQTELPSFEVTDKSVVELAFRRPYDRIERDVSPGVECLVLVANRHNAARHDGVVGELSAVDPNRCRVGHCPAAVTAGCDDEAGDGEQQGCREYGFTRVHGRFHPLVGVYLDLEGEGHVEHLLGGHRLALGLGAGLIDGGQRGAGGVDIGHEVGAQDPRVQYSVALQHLHDIIL